MPTPPDPTDAEVIAAAHAGDQPPPTPDELYGQALRAAYEERVAPDSPGHTYFLLNFTRDAYAQLHRDHAAICRRLAELERPIADHGGPVVMNGSPFAARTFQPHGGNRVTIEVGAANQPRHESFGYMAVRPVSGTVPARTADGVLRHDDGRYSYTPPRDDDDSLMAAIDAWTADPEGSLDFDVRGGDLVQRGRPVDASDDEPEPTENDTIRADLRAMQWAMDSNSIG